MPPPPPASATVNTMAPSQTLEPLAVVDSAFNIREFVADEDAAQLNSSLWKSIDQDAYVNAQREALEAYNLAKALKLSQQTAALESKQRHSPSSSSSSNPSSSSATGRSSISAGKSSTSAAHSQPVPIKKPAAATTQGSNTSQSDEEAALSYARSWQVEGLQAALLQHAPFNPPSAAMVPTTAGNMRTRAHSKSSTYAYSQSQSPPSHHDRKASTIAKQPSQSQHLSLSVSPSSSHPHSHHGQHYHQHQHQPLGLSTESATQSHSSSSSAHMHTHSRSTSSRTSSSNSTSHSNSSSSQAPVPVLIPAASFSHAHAQHISSSASAQLQSQVSVSSSSSQSHHHQQQQQQQQQNRMEQRTLSKRDPPPSPNSHLLSQQQPQHYFYSISSSTSISPPSTQSSSASAAAAAAYTYTGSERRPSVAAAAPTPSNISKSISTASTVSNSSTSARDMRRGQIMNPVAAVQTVPVPSSSASAQASRSPSRSPPQSSTPIKSLPMSLSRPAQAQAPSTPTHKDHKEQKPTPKAEVPFDYVFNERLAGIDVAMFTKTRRCLKCGGMVDIPRQPLSTQDPFSSPFSDRLHLTCRGCKTTYCRGCFKIAKCYERPSSPSGISTASSSASSSVSSSVANSAYTTPASTPASSTPASAVNSRSNSISAGSATKALAEAEAYHRIQSQNQTQTQATLESRVQHVQMQHMHIPCAGGPGCAVFGCCSRVRVIGIFEALSSFDEMYASEAGFLASSSSAASSAAGPPTTSLLFTSSTTGKERTARVEVEERRAFVNSVLSRSPDKRKRFEDMFVRTMKVVSGWLNSAPGEQQYFEAEEEEEEDDDESDSESESSDEEDDDDDDDDNDDTSGTTLSLDPSTVPTLLSLSFLPEVIHFFLSNTVEKDWVQHSETYIAIMDILLKIVTAKERGMSEGILEVPVKHVEWRRYGGLREIVWQAAAMSAASSSAASSSSSTSSSRDLLAVKELRKMGSTATIRAGLQIQKGEGEQQEGITSSSLGDLIKELEKHRTPLMEFGTRFKLPQMKDKVNNLCDKISSLVIQHVVGAL